MKTVTIDGENLYPLNDLKNFNKIFKKDVTYNDIKSHQNSGFHRREESNRSPSSQRFKGKCIQILFEKQIISTEERNTPKIKYFIFFFLIIIFSWLNFNRNTFER